MSGALEVDPKMLKWLQRPHVTLLMEKLEQNPLTFEELVAWVPVATVRARVETLTARGGVERIRVVIDRRSEVDATMRVRYRGRQYRIQSVEEGAATPGATTFVAEMV
ncbi:MAG TPA: head-tail adaptor protein [Nevskiaceae bacterium]